jgi:hypothetical protein
MASTTVLSGLELIKWQRDFMREYVRDSGFKPYMGSELTNIICVKNDLESDGYTIRIPLVGRLKANAGSVAALPLNEKDENLWIRNFFHKIQIVNIASTYDRTKIKSASQELASLYEYEGAGTEIKYLVATIEEILKMPEAEKLKNLKSILDLAKAEAPFPNSPNHDVLNMALVVISIATTILATPFYTHGAEMSLLVVALKAAGIYSLAKLADTFVIPKILPRVSTWIKDKAEPYVTKYKEDKEADLRWRCSGSLYNLRGF